MMHDIISRKTSMVIDKYSVSGIEAIDLNSIMKGILEVST